MVRLEVKGFIPTTMLDWEGMLASTIFLPRCNFRCPYCQNPDLVLNPEKLQTVPLQVILDHLRESDGWVEGVCITGGEPCVHGELPELCSTLKEQGVGVKLDTNGSSPGVLERLIDDRLIDYVAMDVKAPLEANAYRISSGNDRHDLVDIITESIDIIRDTGIDHEFRTTVVPLIHGPAEVEQIAAYLSSEKTYAIQYFNPRTTLDPRFSELKPFSEEDMKEIARVARKHIRGATVRGAPSAIEI